ncbi:MAG: hypothetical protein H6707_11480 [Deltaproteobacteria bacterium]|nr:hypothetical protein [Deltaproteobacteria bacterium]
MSGKRWLLTLSVAAVGALPPLGLLVTRPGDQLGERALETARLYAALVDTTFADLRRETDRLAAELDPLLGQQRADLGPAARSTLRLFLQSKLHQPSAVPAAYLLIDARGHCLVASDPAFERRRRLSWASNLANAPLRANIALVSPGGRTRLATYARLGAIERPAPTLIALFDWAWPRPGLTTAWRSLILDADGNHLGPKPPQLPARFSGSSSQQQLALKPQPSGLAPLSQAHAVVIAYQARAAKWPIPCWLFSVCGGLLGGLVGWLWARRLTAISSA